MNKILLTGIAILIIVGAFLFIGNKKQTAPTGETQSPVIKTQKTEVPTQGPNVTVEATKTGFVPQTTTIKTGTQVVWKNTSGESATVNSDPHPTHTLYPFLNLGAFDNGSSVNVVFDKPGTYTYHNHFNSSQKGKVIVE